MTDSKDSLGDRMKSYEQSNAGRLMPLLPAMARLDGKSFHSFARGLARPYDKRLSDLMVATTSFLVAETNARIGYTQSDEISLVWYSSRHDSELFFAGKVAKMTSVLAAMATWYFNSHLASAMPEKAGIPALFDCRVWNVPTQNEAVNTLIWREMDATRNSVQMAARSVYSHNQLFGKGTSELQEMLFQKGINWNDYPSFFKRGTYIQRRMVHKPFTSEKIDKLPPKHHARLNPDLVVERHQVQAVNLPPLARIENRVHVVFDGVFPITSSPS